MVSEGGTPVALEVPNLGATSLSHPIRKRAFNRALRRGELWLIHAYSLSKEKIKEMGTFAQIYPDHMCPNDTCYITWPWQYRGMRAWLPDGLIHDLIPPPSLWFRIKSWFRR